MLLYKRRVKIIMERIIEIDLIDKYDLVEKYNEKNVSNELIKYIINEAMYIPKKDKIVIKTPEDIANMLMKEMKYAKREMAKVVLLNTKNIVQKIVNVSLGASNFAVIEPKDVFVDAIKMQIPRIILVHNHPSGDPTPSKADFNMTDRIYEGAELLGIELLDHIIIGDEKFESIF